MNAYHADFCDKTALLSLKPQLSFNPEADFEGWKQACRAKLEELLGDKPELVEPNVTVEWEKDHEDFREIRFVFDAEKHSKAACHLLIPSRAPKPCPVVICLQGHSTGMHISLGRAKYPGDEESISGGDRDFALQIVGQGYAALVLEQRGFGERKTSADDLPGCEVPALNALLIGRTLLGERVWDVSRAIDVLAAFPGLDGTRIACMGNSGGGTTSFYAACLDERIQVVMPSCSICTYRDSIGAIRHCSCNYIPGIAKYFDMGDLAGLIAPRRLIVVAGQEDPIFPIQGVKEAYGTVRAVYEKSGHPENCRLIVGDGGHRFYAAPAWSTFKELTGW